MSTNPEKPLNGTPEPFRRPVVWGRPPQTVFRAGPLPKGERLPPLPVPPRRSGADIFGGSMIPRAAPARPPAPAAAPTPTAAPAPTAASSNDHAADLTVRPLPPLEPVRPAAPLQLDTLPAFRPTVSDDAERSVPGQAARPAPVARKAANRTPLYAGIAVAAVTALALGGWVWTRSPTGAPTAAVAPAPALPAASVAGPPEPSPVPAAVIEIPAASPAPVRPVSATPAPRPGAAATRPAAARAPSPVVARPAAPSPEAVAPPPVIVTAPQVEIVPAPPAGPPPTEAERPQTDPDAPITTRPQPIG